MAVEVTRLRALSQPELVDEYRRLWGKEPRVKNKGWLWKRCAMRIQERLYGGLSKKAKERLEELIAMLGIDFAKPAGAKATLPSPAATPGTSLVRDWNGERIVVRVLEDGFEWRGERFKSLSAVAKAATGQHVSGPAFFGLTDRRARA